MSTVLSLKFTAWYGHHNFEALQIFVNAISIHRFFKHHHIATCQICQEPTHRADWTIRRLKVDLKTLQVKYWNVFVPAGQYLGIKL